MAFWDALKDYVAGRQEALTSLIQDPGGVAEELGQEAGAMLTTPYHWLAGTDWGGTTHLEKKSAAFDTYTERLFGWSKSDAYPHWSEAELDLTLTDAIWLRDNTTSAAEFWSAVSGFWEVYAIGDASIGRPAFTSLDSEQMKKIVEATGASEDAALTYAKNRQADTHYDLDLLKLPWWVYGLGGLVLLNTIRK